MSYNKNMMFSYATQGYVTVVGIVFLPVYMSLMGSQAYGLIGFFSMLQSWFALLDLGLSPTISRQTARYYSGKLDDLGYFSLIKILSLIFLIVALIGGSAIFYNSDFIAYSWLESDSIKSEDIKSVIQIIAFCVALRWMSGLYRGIILGSERIIWLGAFNSVVATLRFIVVIPVMYFFGFTPLVYFLYQLFVIIFEVVGLIIKSRKITPQYKSYSRDIKISIEPIKPILKFSLTIAFTSSIWIFTTQTDKLVLSGILPLDEYGYFTLSVLVANGILILGTPMSNVIMPRLSRLYAEDKIDEMIDIYKYSTQIMIIIAGSLSMTIAIFPEDLIYLWTGDSLTVEKVAPILQLYAIGNGLLSIGIFPYYLQYAKGNLKYHFLGNILLATLMIPSIIYFSTSYGAIGAAKVWLVMNLVYVLVWVGFVHYKIHPGINIAWYRDDIMKIIIPTFISLSLIKINIPLGLSSRVDSLIIFSISLVISLIVSTLFSSFRYRLFDLFRLGNVK